MRTIIAGTRDFTDYTLLETTMSLIKDQVTEVVSGKQRKWNVSTNGWEGADYYGEMWAKLNNIPIKPFPADWDEFGRAAGPIRNAEMAEYADFLVVFWDGKSRGTKDMIDKMKKKKKLYHIVRYK